MPKNCCAVGCSNVYTKRSGIQFYRFPADAERRTKWIAAVGRNNWSPTEYTWICSEHFVSGAKSNNPLAPNYLPTLFKHIESSIKRKLEGRVQDFERRQGAKRRRIEEAEKDKLDKEAAIQLQLKEQEANKKLEEEAERKRMEEINLEKQHQEALLRRHKMVLENKRKQKEAEEQRDTSMVKERSKLIHDMQKITEAHDGLMVKCKEMKHDLDVTNSAKSRLESMVDALSSRVLNESAITNDERKVHYYTGLSSLTVLRAVFNITAKDLPIDDTQACTLFEQFLITLIKLRLNLGDQDLAYRFAISQPSVSRYTSRWLDLLSTKLDFLIHWPDRQELMKIMPTDFRKHFKKCVIIIDCFEVFIERPTSLKARAQTYSNYKKHNTVKFLIGIMPQGSIAFVSKGWGGRVSDVYITENSGLLRNLLPGDLILADRGFTIEQILGLYCAEVKIPSFTKGKKQLSKLEVDTTRRLAQVRIHVERVIGLVRQKYRILQSTLPINMIKCDDDLSAVDKIVTICCALCNCCDSVVPFN